MGCASAKPNIKVQTSCVQQGISFDLSENGSFAYAPTSTIASQRIAPRADAFDSEWQLHSKPHIVGRIRRVNITVDANATPTTSPQLQYETPFDYKPPLTAMTADSKQSYFMYAESSAPDIHAPREAIEFENDTVAQENDPLLNAECSTATDDIAPINESGSHRIKGLGASLGLFSGSRRLDETCLEFHNAGRSEADATDIQEERINEALLQARENENEEATPAEAAETSRGDHRTDSNHSHPLGSRLHPSTIPHSSSGLLTIANNVFQSQDDLAQSPIHRNLLAETGRTARGSLFNQDFPFIHITQPAPFLSKSRHESVRDWLVHIDMTKQKEPVSPQSGNADSTFTNFTGTEVNHPLPSECETATLTKKVSGNTLSSFHNLRHCSIEGMTDETATNRSSPSTTVPAFMVSN